jgi:hypothetical protein
MTKRRIAIALGLLALAIAAGVDLDRLRGAVPWRNMIDFSAFYCAGRAVLHRESPYGVEPLRACEHGLNRGASWDDPAYVIPAPLPPYDFPPYAFLSLLRFDVAKAIVAIVILISVVVTGLALADLGIPFPAAIAALALSAGFTGMFLGQIYPLTIALLALAAAALKRERNALAGFFAALTLVQPQIGGAICLTLFVWASRTRLALAATGCAVAIFGAWMVGTQPFVVWLTRVIPAQARAEVSFWGQYSLTSVLATAGVPPEIALLAGSVSFVMMLGLAIWLAQRLANRLRSPQYLVLVPAALGVIGGTYVHLAQIAAAIPLALALAQVPAAPGRQWRAAVPLILLSIPWAFAQALKALFFSSVLVVTIVVINLRISARQATLIVLVAAAGLYLIALHTPPALAPATFVSQPPEAGATLASNHVAYAPVDLSRELAKVPTWAGLLALLGLALRIAVGHDGEAT